MEVFIHFFILLPVVSFFLSLLIPKKSEQALSMLAYTSVGVQFVTALVFSVIWIFNKMEPINMKEFSVYQASNYDFFIDFMNIFLLS
jgi:membrane-associated PAP2 superfamily phosphatase